MAENQTAESLGDLLDHEYDGIREYDNPCPGWWAWLFFLTAVFAAAYFFYFQVGKAGISVQKDHENAVADNVRLRFAEIGELTPDEPTLIKYMQESEAEWLQVGRSVYEQQCKTCHGDEGRGLVGPNLTDDYYKNVEKLGDVLTVIIDGAGNGSMPSWKRLHPNEILLVSAYVATLRGKNLPSPRQAEGKLIPPWPTASGEEIPEPAETGADNTTATETSEADDKPVTTEAPSPNAQKKED
jgi:cytochrome c oxidase cbb3-type subunit 3